MSIGSLIDSFSRIELKNIVENSFSYAEVLSKLGYSTINGRNSNTLKNRLNYYNISTEHFTHKSQKKDWNDSEIFCENSKVSQKKLRKTFKEKNFIPYKCATCGLEPVWNNKPLVLTLDHKNGINKDNRIENLQWVCPNCDRQSNTYGMKNKKILQKNIVLYPVSDFKNIKYKKTNIEIPNRTELKSKLWELKNFTNVSNYYNVSTTQIRRWCRYYNLPATINIIKCTSETGWLNENWCDIPPKNNYINESKPCLMIDIKTDKVLMEFESLKKAGRYIKPDAINADSHIGAVCNGKRKTAYGYKWQYVINNK